MKADPDFHPIAAAWLEGAATPPEQRLLDELLAAGPAAMEDYAALCRTDALLHQAARSAAERRKSLASVLSGKPWPQRAAGILKSRTVRWAAAAAALVVGIWALWPAAVPEENQTVRKNRVPPQAAHSVARTPNAVSPPREAPLPPGEDGVEQWLQRYYVCSFDSTGPLPEAATTLAAAIKLEDGSALTVDVRDAGDAPVHLKLGVSLPAWRLMILMGTQSGTEPVVSGRSVVFRAAQKPWAVASTTGANAYAPNLRRLFGMKGELSADELALFSVFTLQTFGSRIAFENAEDSFVRYNATWRDFWVLEMAQSAPVLPHYQMNFTVRALSLPKDTFPAILAEACGIRDSAPHGLVLTDAQMQQLLRVVEKTKGVDVLTMPAATAPANEEVRVSTEPIGQEPQQNGLTAQLTALAGSNGQVSVDYRIITATWVEEIQETIRQEDVGKFTCESGSTRAIRGTDPANGKDNFYLLTAAVEENAGIRPVITGDTPAPAAPPQEDLPYGIPVIGEKGKVQSPYAPDKGFVDVEGFKRGTRVACPYTGKYFRVP